MKRTTLLATLFCFFALSCSEKNDPTPAPPPSASFMNMVPASSWNYEVINNAPPATTTSYTLTSTNKDSTIGTRQYHVYTNSSTGASEYYFAAGGDYYTFQSLPAALGGAKVENLYLKAGAAINTTWDQKYDITYNFFPVEVTITHKITAKNLARTVNGIVYNDVIQVTTGIAVSGVPPAALTTDIQYYYAPNFGLIENTSRINLNYLGIVNNTDVTSRLKTSNLK